MLLRDFLAQSAYVDVELTTLLTEQASYSRVIQELKSHSYDIVFYAGHAVETPESPEQSGLFFWSEPDRMGKIRKMSALELGFLLNASTVRLVYLSCGGLPDLESATRPQEQSVLGIADAVLRAGVPTVIAHRFPVPDNEVSDMTLIFFESLLKNGYPDVALWRARREMAAKDRNSIVWLSPFLIHQA